MPGHQTPPRSDWPSDGSSGQIDVELLAFVERYAINLTRWDILLFFGRNPCERESAQGIARQIGRRPQAVEKELQDLAYLGVLEACPNGTARTFKLASVAETRGAVVRMASHFERKVIVPAPIMS